MLQAQDTQSESKNSNPTVFNTDKLPVGTPLFLASYQTNTTKPLRNPNEESYDDVTSGSNEPAVYGGLVLDYWDNGNIVAAIGIKSYNAGRSDVGLLGGSGAPVYADGKLVGLSVRGSNPSTISRLGRMAGVTIKGVDPNSAAELVIIQSVTDQLLHNRQMALAKAAPCIQ